MVVGMLERHVHLQYPLHRRPKGYHIDSGEICCECCTIVVFNTIPKITTNIWDDIFPQAVGFYVFWHPLSAEINISSVRIQSNGFLDKKLHEDENILSPHSDKFEAFIVAAGLLLFVGFCQTGLTCLIQPSLSNSNDWNTASVSLQVHEPSLRTAQCFSTKCIY